MELLFHLTVLCVVQLTWGLDGRMHEKSFKKLKTSSGRPWEDDFRLPSSNHPDHYDLYLHPNLDTKTFSGRVTIHVTVNDTTQDHFLVHTKWLSISDTRVVKVVGEATEDVNIIDAFEYEPNEFWVIRTSEVEPGSYRLSMNFSGSLKNGIVGFYYSDYADEDGVQRGLATTKFEPTYARRAFPCFDEPTFKSTYSVTVVRPTERYIALSNMPIMSEAGSLPSEGLTEVTFEKSVPMVTYLVCFIVCDFTYKETVMSSGMPFRVYAPKGRIENSQYALDTGAKILQMYEVMFDLPFPLPKSDMAAIPDYSSGATEHWGIITFRETSIFYNKNQSSAANKQRVASVVAHELAHQWFGNLVTLEWWNDLWLNEGFASYVEFKGVNHVHPEWEMESQFPIINLQSVFYDDSKLSSHPIVQTVENPDEINAMFDTISYDKGSSVLRMLEDFMGEDSFQAGINAFLKKYAYDNAVTNDLWTELTAAWEGNHPASEKGDVGGIMDTWTRQMGYPVVNVTRSAPDTLTITQDRFLQDPTAEFNPAESEFGYRWDIPIGYITSKDANVTKAWHYLEEDYLQIKINPEVSWVKLNVNQKGYYRVNYEPAMWDVLAKLCADKQLGTSDRASLYNDALALADAELLDYPVALNLTRSLVFETDYVPWSSTSGSLVVMERLLLETLANQPFCDYVINLVEPVYNSLGWADTGDHLQKLLRIDIVTLACASGSKSCLNEAAAEVNQWIVDANHPMPLGTKRQVYRWGVVQGGTQEMWETMWHRALAESSATETDNLYYGMANFQDTNILERYIELAQDENNVRSQNFLHILQYISTNPAGSDLTWNWVRSNWEWLVDRYTLNDRYLGQLIPDISKYFASPRKLAEMEEFFANYPEAGAGELYREQALESIRSNIRWVEAYSGTILDWLNSQKM